MSFRVKVYLWLSQGRASLFTNVTFGIHYISYHLNSVFLRYHSLFCAVDTIWKTTYRKMHLQVSCKECFLFGIYFFFSFFGKSLCCWCYLFTSSFYTTDVTGPHQFDCKSIRLWILPCNSPLLWLALGKLFSNSFKFNSVAQVVSKHTHAYLMFRFQPEHSGKTRKFLKNGNSRGILSWIL